MKSARKRPLYLDPNLHLIFGVTLSAVMGVSSITPVFPAMARELDIPVHSVGLLITVFTLPGIFLAPVLGVLADLWGRKRILVPALMLFGIAGGACGFVRDFNLLLALRFLQGMGAASLASLNATIIGDLYSGNELAAAMGYNATVLNIGTASYPAIGGILATLGWFYPFFLPFIAIPVGFLILFSLQSPEPNSRQGFKVYLDNVWQSIKTRQVFMLFLASVVTFIILYGSYLTYLPILLGHSFHASSFTIGIIMSIMSLTTAVSSSQLGRLSTIYSPKTLLRTAFIFYAVALISIPFIHSLWLLPLPIVIFGMGHGMSFPNIQTLLAALAPSENRGAFMSINGMVLRLGQTLGPVLMGIVLLGWGIQGVFYAGAVCSMAMFMFLVAIGK
ncbi:MAG: MFS transporter [Desulfatiglandales bacterium]